MLPLSSSILTNYLRLTIYFMALLSPIDGGATYRKTLVVFNRKIEWSRYFLRDPRTYGHLYTMLLLLYQKIAIVENTRCIPVLRGRYIALYILYTIPLYGAFQNVFDNNNNTPRAYYIIYTLCSVQRYIFV